MKAYLEIIKKCINKDENFNEALEIAEGNSSGGKIWIVGSFLYKNILKEKYGLDNLIVKDYDFILENQTEYSKAWAPENWEIRKTFFGSPRFVKEKLQVDAYELSKATKDFRKNNSEEKIRSYLKNVLFDIQAMAYDIKNEKIYDEGSINAIERKEMKVTCLEDSIGIANKKGISLKEYLDYKAKGIGIKAIYPDIR